MYTSEDNLIFVFILCCWCSCEKRMCENAYGFHESHDKPTRWHGKGSRLHVTPDKNGYMYIYMVYNMCVYIGFVQLAQQFYSSLFRNSINL